MAVRQHTPTEPARPSRDQIEALIEALIDAIDEIDPVLRDARLLADLLAAAGDDDHVDCELVRRTGHALRWRLRDIEEILSRANDRRRQQALARGAA